MRFIETLRFSAWRLPSCNHAVVCSCVCDSVVGHPDSFWHFTPGLSVAGNTDRSEDRPLHGRKAETNRPRRSAAATFGEEQDGEMPFEGSG